MVDGPNVGLSNWEGPVLSFVVSRTPYGPMDSSYCPWFCWAYSSSSEWRDGDTDVHCIAASNVAVWCLVLTGCIPDIVAYGKFKLSYCMITNSTFLFHTVVDGEWLFELYK